MRKSLRDIRDLEAYLEGRLSQAEQQRLQTALLVSPTLYEALVAQQGAYQLIRECGRQQLKTELEQIHVALMREEGKRHWRERVLAFFG